MEKIDKRTKEYKEDLKEREALAEAVGVRPDQVSSVVEQSSNLPDSEMTATLGVCIPPIEDEPLNYERCNDPHGIGCKKLHPPEDHPRGRLEPCYDCIWRNK